MLRGFTPGYAHKLHKKYGRNCKTQPLEPNTSTNTAAGRIVRTGPDEVSIADIGDVKKVYDHKETFIKHPAYRTLAPSKVDSMFNTSDIELHRRYRRLLAPPMSESSLKPIISEVYSHANATIYKMSEELQTRGAIDIFKWWWFYATDTVGDLTFGSSFNMTESGKVSLYKVF